LNALEEAATAAGVSAAHRLSAVLVALAVSACRLNSLQFEWELSDQEARWHHLYHQLRRYRLLYGSSEVDSSSSGGGQGGWSAVAR
jgi:uncharacterized protein (DUF952 family)